MFLDFGKGVFFKKDKKDFHLQEMLMKNFPKIFCEAFSGNDSEAFGELFAEDAVYTDSLYGKYIGRKAIINFHERCHKEATNYRFSPTNVITEKNYVVFEWDFMFTSLLPFAKGVQVNLEGCSIITVQRNLIFSYKEFCDSIAILLKGRIPESKILKFYKKKYNIE